MELTVKGTVSRDDFGFWEHAWSVLGPNRGRGQFLNFFGAPVIFNAKSVFLAFNASLHWPNNVSGVYLTRFPCFLLVTGFGRFLQVSALASHWLDDCANFTPMPEENDHYSANHSQCNTSSKPIHFYQWTIILHLWLAWMTKISSWRC